MAVSILVAPTASSPCKKEKPTSTPTPFTFPPPLIACISYIVCSTALTLANKRVFTDADLVSPWTLLCSQSFAVTLILSLYLLLSGRHVFNLQLARQMILPCILFTAYIYTNSQALRNVSLPILSVLKSFAPMGIALAERFAFRDRITPGTAAAMLLIVVGNTLTMLNDLEFSVQGYVWAIANVVINIAYVLSLRICLTDDFTPVEKALHSNLIACSIMIPLAYSAGELTHFLSTIATTSITFRVTFLLSCFLCSGIGAAIFWVVQTTSGSTLSFVGACNKFLVVILGGILFQANISPVGWLSVCFGVVAGVIFALAKAKERDHGDDCEKLAATSSTIVDVNACDSQKDLTTPSKSLLQGP